KRRGRRTACRTRRRLVVRIDREGRHVAVRRLAGNRDRRKARVAVQVRQPHERLTAREETKTAAKLRRTVAEDVPVEPEARGERAVARGQLVRAAADRILDERVA